MTTPGAPARAARPAWLPWVAAGVLAVVVAGLIVVLAHVMQVRRDTDARGARVVLSSKNQEAVLAAGTEAANLLTYSRKSFDADWQRAVDGTTGALRKDQVDRKADALKTITDQKVDLYAKVQHSAFEGADENGNVVVLVTVNGYQRNDQGATSAATPQRLELTMVEQGGKWLATNLSSIGIQ